MQTKKYSHSLSYFTITIFTLATVIFLSAIPVKAEETPKPPIGDKIRANIENRLEKNKEVRNIEMNRRSSTSPSLMSQKVERPQAFMLRATTSGEFMLKKAQNGERGMSQTMKARAFEIRKNNLERQLNIALSNLENIMLRIQDRIKKLESEGKDVAEAKTLLATAQVALTQAKTDVSAFEALVISTPMATTTTQVEVDIELTRPRILGDKAIKSIKEARDAMKEVLKALK